MTVRVEGRPDWVTSKKVTARMKNNRVVDIEEEDIMCRPPS